MAASVLAASIAMPRVAASAPAAGATGDEGASDAIAKIVDVNRQGVALYRRGQLPEARRLLRSALELCKASGLERHPVAARTHIHLGIVLVAGFGLADAGAREFREALAIEPAIDLTPGLATPAVQVVFNEEFALAPSAREAMRAAAPVAFDATDDGAAPAIRRRAARDDDGDDDEEPSDDDEGAWTSRLDLRLLTGMGGGWASGAGELNVDAHTGAASFSGSLLNHATVAVGYWLRPTWMLSLEGRFQRVAGPTIVAADGRTYHPATGAVAVFATATWSPRFGALRPFVSASAGAGRIREVVTFSQLHDCGPSRAEVCVDTVGGGPALAGAAAGLTYDLGKKVAVVASLGAQVAVPTTTFNLDLNAGFALRL
jgi:hypothetical protein